MHTSSSSSVNFRHNHLVELLCLYEKQTKPLDFVVSDYFRSHKALGSKDRAYIAETIYALIRWKGLYDYLLQEQNYISWEKRIELLHQKNPDSFLDDESIPLHIRLSFPEVLFSEIVASFGPEVAKSICFACNSPAPTCIRVNIQKISREALLAKFKEQKFDVSLSKESSLGIIFHKKINFFGLQEFRDGLFEIQDEASQLVASMAKPAKTNRVLDFCAGAGGKTLAFAEALGGTGQIYLHDIRQGALLEAKKRLKRAGIQNAQIIHESEKVKLKALKKKMNVVFVDVPCSGTGTLRRNPDMKWKFSLEMLNRLASEQRVIFEQALSYLHPEGRIIYATCSILKKENQDQVEHFLKTYPLQVEGEIFQSTPKKGEKDGFFAVCFKKIQ